MQTERKRENRDETTTITVNFVTRTGNLQEEERQTAILRNLLMTLGNKCSEFNGNGNDINEYRRLRIIPPGQQKNAGQKGKKKNDEHGRTTRIAIKFTATIPRYIDESEEAELFRIYREHAASLQPLQKTED